VSNSLRCDMVQHPNRESILVIIASGQLGYNASRLVYSRGFTGK
jgi:hypothetical protein